MPNWCDTTYKCVGEPKEVKSLYKILKYIDKRKTTIIENGFGKWWLGNLVHKLDGDWNELRCRGEITGYGLDGNILTIYQSTAWCEQEGVREQIERTFPGIKVYYREEEPGCGVYYTNDSSGDYFPEQYYLDSYNDDSEYFRTVEEAAGYVSGIIGKDVEPDKNSIGEALEEYMDQQDDKDIWYSFHEFTIVE
ncbi:hypothetical protein [Bacteroides clarus]|uniref:YubB ferredoxin-like domain-containing protein n=1 Tax=Bacteroides clarus TaxID=626929 RepID=A0A1Y3YU44_9BACE|nr:hypothetical protein [Bacteroides clarus]OUO01364.1 hypothetical protein B5F97_06795 [Bacteroides clarus]